MSGRDVKDHPTAHLARANRGKAAAQLACPDSRCGQPQTGPGHPRKGWVQIKAAGERTAPWFCSWHCVSHHAIRRELRGDA